MQRTWLLRTQFPLGKSWRHERDISAPALGWLCRFSLGLGLFLLFVTLTGCAGMQAFREGNALLAEGKHKEGLSKFEEAVRLEPKNAEYRMALAVRRASIVHHWLTLGDAARRDDRLDDADTAYRKVQEIDPHHAMAEQGLKAVAAARRHRQWVQDAEALFRQDGGTRAMEALDKLRPVLVENPGHKAAQALKSQIDAATAQATTSEAALAALYRKPVTLEFRDAPLRSIFDAIAQVSGLNVFFDSEVRADLRASVFAKNTSTQEAIRLLLTTNQLNQKILNENSILIYPNTPHKLREYQTLSVRTFYLANADVKAIANTLKTIVKVRDLVVDERLGLLIVRDTPEAIRLAERLVALQDLSDPEVMLEVEVMEIKRSRLLELGLQWPTQLGLSPIPTGTSPLTLQDLRTLNQSTIQADIGRVALNARKEDQDGNILANPRIRVRNKEKAKILIGDRVPVITTTSSANFAAESISYLDVGLKLEVEPNIYLDEEVAIKVNLEVSNLVREITSKTGTLSYQIGTRSANTVLRLKDSETQVLAGLISDEDRSTANKVPGLGELPILGRLFGSQRDDSQRSEILLSITPHILRSIRRPGLAISEFESGTEASMGAMPAFPPPAHPAPAPRADMSVMPDPATNPVPVPAGGGDMQVKP